MAAPLLQMDVSPLISAATPAAVAAVLLLLVLHEVFSDTAEDGTSDCSQEAVVGLLAKEMTTKTTADGAK